MDIREVGESVNKLYEIFPVPQEIHYGGGVVKLTESINIIIDADVKESTLVKLKGVLSNKGLTYVITEQVEEGKTNIHLTLLAEATLKEGYRLSIEGEEIAKIIISGCDSNGIHYGVVTLSAILDQISNSSIQKCVINDYPEILYRGFIEGFYGFPWSHEDRIDLMQFGSEYKMNTYIYAPKDDPYHRKSWRELYPEEKAQELVELAQAGHRNNLNFVWTIHPGDSIDLGSEEDLQSALHKLEQLYTLGIRQFGVLFDDIGGVPNGKEQAEFINRIDQEFVKMKGDVRPLITVGTRYCEAWGPSMEDYFKPFVETLHEDIEVMWTGSATMSNIAKEQYGAPMEQIQSDKKLSVWWNYPVNDYCDSKILMGKIKNLKTDLDNVNGFFSNPMNQAQASKQALFCIADYAWNTDIFDCEAGFTASFKALAPEVASELEIFASNCCYLNDDGGKSGAFLFDESWEIKEPAQMFIHQLEEGKDTQVAAQQLERYFIKLENAALNILEKCLNAELIKELKPFLEASYLLAKSGQNVIQAVAALKTGDLLTMEKKNEEALQQLLETNQCKVHRLKDSAERDLTVDVGTLVIRPFITQMITLSAVVAGTEAKSLELHHDMRNIALDSLGAKVTASQSASKFEDASHVITGKIAGGKWCSSANRPQLTIELNQSCAIKQYRIVNCGHPEANETKLWNTRHVQILASNDGEQFSLIDEVVDNDKDVIDRILFNEIEAKYIRLQIVEPTQLSMGGSGDTRIYAFELYDQSYPTQSEKVISSDISIANDKIQVRHVKKGDQIAVYRGMNEKIPFAVTEEADYDMDRLTLEGIALDQDVDRIFVERTTRGYLPSIRTSKGFIKKD